MPKLEMASAAFPVLVRVAIWTALAEFTRCAGKVSVETLKLAAGAVPVPESVAGGIAILVLLLTVSEPLRTPGALGWNVTLIVQ